MAEFIYTMKKARKAHGDKVILDDVTLMFLPGAKIGVVGPNGSGKSTVLQIMAGLQQPSNGEAFLSPGYTVGILLQEPPLDETKTVLQNVQEGVAETIELVVATNWLTESDLKQIWEWTWCTRTGQEFNFLRDAADYLDRQNIATKRQFYDDWYQYVIGSNGLINKHFRKAKSRIDNYIFGLASQSLGYRETLTENRDKFYTEARDFLKQYDLDEQLLTELINYCDARLFNYDASYPIKKTFNYNFLTDTHEKVILEFHPTLFGAASSTAMQLLEGSSRVSDNFKIRQTLTCTLMEPRVVI